MRPTLTRLRASTPSLRSLLLWPYLLLSTAGLLALVVWAGFWLQNLMVEKAEHELEIEAFIIANALREPLDEWIHGEVPERRPIGNLVLSYAHETKARLVVALPDGRIVFSSDPNTPVGVLPPSVEIQAALAYSEQHDIRPDDFGTGEMRLYAAAPVTEGSEVIGVVQLSVPYAPLQNQIRLMWLRLGLFSALLVSAIAAASIMLARALSSPIQHLTEVAERLAEGELETPVHPHGPFEVRRLALAFRTMARRLHEMLEQQRQFAAHAAHELRSPLASVRLRLEMLERMDADLELDRRQRYLREASQQLARLEGLVNDLLLLASLEQENAMPTESLDLAPLLYELADEVAPLLRAKKLRLHVDVPPHLPPVQANATHLRVAVRNLLDNAVKYTPEGGTITLRGTANEQEITVEVRDSGPGIPPDELPHIFHRFYRSKRVRGSSVEGTGLGLAIVQAVAERHRGRVEVESQPGKGTTFRLSLPRA